MCLDEDADACSKFQPVALNRSTIDGSALDPPQPPHVQPSYYAALLIDTFIGRSGHAQLVELSVPSPNVTGYAAFEDGLLRRAVFVNLEAWLQSSETAGERPTVHLDLLPTFSLGATNAEVDSYHSRQTQVRRLLIQHADDVSALLWAGQSYETLNARPVGRAAVEHVDVRDGIDLRATEAVLISF